MNKQLLCFVVLTISFVSSFAQVSVTNAKTKSVASIVQQYLISPNIELVQDGDPNHAAMFNGQTTINSNQIGTFTNNIKNDCDMPMESGIIIATCEASGKGEGSSASPSYNPTDSVFFWTYTKYCIENGQEIKSLNNIGHLSFWIKPTIDNFQFSYCFASDEYSSFVHSNYNDFFGFYFSGPYDSVGNYVKGATTLYMQNLALIPGTQIPVMINTVNHGKNDQPPMDHPEFHILPVGNCKNSTSFNEYTKKLPTADYYVIAGAYYKIDIMICNVSDQALQSALFLSKDIRRFDTINIDTTICENDPGYYSAIVDKYINQEGFYSITGKNETGGDSIININLHVNPEVLENHCWFLKQGDNFDVDYMNISAPGTFIFKYKTYLGCDSTISYEVKWGEETMETDCNDPNFDIKELKSSNNILNIYPNPTKDVLYIDGAEYNSLVEIFDLQGKKVKEQIIKNISSPTVINIKDIQAGNYVVKITKDNLSIKKKLIIQ